MAERIEEAAAKWRVRLADGEFELDLPELEVWIAQGRVDRSDLVRPPVTRRWKRAENCVELTPALDRYARARREREWAAGGPAREAAARSRAAAAKVQSWQLVVLLGLVLGFGGGFMVLKEGGKDALPFALMAVAAGALIWVPGLIGWLVARRRRRLAS